MISLLHSSGDRTQEGTREAREKGGPSSAGCSDNQHKDSSLRGQGQNPKEKPHAGRPGQNLG